MDKLASQIKETEVLVRRRKAQVATIMAAGGEAGTAELAAITKLEVQLANLRLLGEAREILSA